MNAPFIFEIQNCEASSVGRKLLFEFERLSEFRQINDIRRVEHVDGELVNQRENLLRIEHTFDESRSRFQRQFGLNSTNSQQTNTKLSTYNNVVDQFVNVFFVEIFSSIE